MSAASTVVPLLERTAAIVVLPVVAALSVLGIAFRGRRRAAKGDGG